MQDKDLRLKLTMEFAAKFNRTGWTQKKLAKHCEVSENTIHRVIARRELISVETLEKMNKKMDEFWGTNELSRS